MLDDDYKPVTIVNKYLKYLDNFGKSPNTQRSYAYDLKLYLEYISANVYVVVVFFNHIHGQAYNEINLPGTDARYHASRIQAPFML